MAVHQPIMECCAKRHPAIAYQMLGKLNPQISCLLFQCLLHRQAYLMVCFNSLVKLNETILTFKLTMFF